MRTDRFGFAHTSENPAAIEAFENVVYAIAAHRPTGTYLAEATKADSDMVAAHAIGGFGNITLARTETMATAQAYLTSAEAALASRAGGTQHEKVLVNALQKAVQGKLRQAADALDAHLIDHPHDFLSLKLSHALRFMSGQQKEMLKTTASVISHWSQEQEAYGFLLGCHSFGLEENGYYRAAEEFGRNAYRHEKADAWGLHAVSHVMEMCHRTKEGAVWLEETHKDWRYCNNFAYHLGWHLSLFKLEDGDHDSVLKLYDEVIRPVETDDFRDMSNAASILWRLEQEGLSVGNRWIGLKEIASKRRQDVTYVFGTLHYLLVLAALGDQRGVEELVSELRLRAAGNDDQAQIARDVGLPIAHVIIERGFGSPHLVDLADAARNLKTIGGSHAQRDVFMRTLMLAAADAGDTRALGEISRVRQSLKSSDRFVRIVEQRYKQARQSDLGGSAQSIGLAY